MKIKIVPFLLTGLLCFAFAKAHAFNVKQSPISEVKIHNTVALTSATWTKCTGISAATTLGGRAGAIVTNPSTNNASIYYTMDDAAPAIATSTICIEIEAGENKFVAVGDGLDVYALTKHTSTESIGVIEIKP